MTDRFRSATLSRYSEVSMVDVRLVLLLLVLASLLSFLAADMLPNIEVVGLAPSTVLVDSLAGKGEGAVLLVLAVPQMLVLTGRSAELELELNPNENADFFGSLLEVVAGAVTLARKEKGEPAAGLAAGLPKPKSNRSEQVPQVCMDLIAYRKSH